MASAPLRFGLWIDFRNPPRWPQDPPALYEATLQLVERAEALGWDDVWLSEHHFVPDGYTPSMLPLAAAIAARTNRVRIGTAALLLPLHDPIRVAEDAATIDLLSDGRFDLGVAAGYRVAEFAGFDVPLAERRGRMDEALPLLRRLFAGERVVVDGLHYRYDGIELHPRPVQDELPIWVGGFSAAAARRAGRLGDGYLGVGPVAPLVEVCRREREAAGLDPADFEVAAGLPWLLVSHDPERRWREAREHFLYQINLYAEWFGEAGMAVAAPAESDDDLERQGVAIVGPDEATERIAAYVAANGVDRYYSWTVPPGLPPAWSDEHLELMAREVMPELR